MTLIAAAAVVAALSQPVGQAQVQDPRPYHDLICSYDWPCEQAYRVAQCESTLNPNAYAAGSYGLYQVNGSHAWMVGGDPTAFYDVETNVRIAHSLWEASGWVPWAYCGRQ